ncbi:MAG: hypothetical protein JSV49_03485, partial [Thermoplasmata archaeon]
MDLTSHRLKIGILALVVILVITASTGLLIQYQASRTTQVSLISFNYDRAYDDELGLTSIGPRAAGTAGELAGAQYVQDQFEAAGLENV